MITPRLVFRAALVAALAVSTTGCIVLPLDVWGGHGRRGGRHLDSPPPQQQPHSHEAPRPRHRDGRP